MTDLGLRALSLATAAVAAVVGVLWGVHIVDGRERLTTVPPGDRVEGAVAALRESDVYVAPDGRDMLPEDGEARLERVIAEAPVPVHVVVWEASSQAGGEPYSFTLTDMIADQLDEPGVYIVWQGPEDAEAEAGPGFGIDYDVPDLEPAGDAETRMTEFVQGLGKDSLVEQEDSDYWGGTGGGIAAGALMGGGIAVGVWLLAGIVRAANGRPFLNRPRGTRTRPRNRKR